MIRSYRTMVFRPQHRSLKTNSKPIPMPTEHCLYLVTGMPASGKSTFARELARRANACLLDIDTVTEKIVQAAMKRLTNNPDDRDSPVFKDTFRDPIYQTLFAVADENLPHSDVIVTGPFTKEQANRDWLDQVQSRLSAPCRIRCAYVYCSPELRRKRILERANPRDAAKLRNWEEHLKYYAPERFPAYPHIAVDTGSSDPFGSALRQGLISR